ncbi:unnamed protein product [Urochloa decumbens]|uniref:Obtusifoliol 14-alpha demethylase n=1 Tax=Urochloa decumbens TaxID=240449 RepID=A0ABC9AY45_9POAL
MYMTSGATAIWVAIATVFVTAVMTRVVRARTKHDSVSTRAPPPVVKCGSVIGLFYTMFTKGFRAMIQHQYEKLGSVFTISFFGPKVTFLIGPEVSGHFYQGLDSEINHGRILEFTVPMFGKAVGYGVDDTTRREQYRFQFEALRPSKLKSNVALMLQEVEDYFAKWGPQGMVDLKQELSQILMLIAGRCLLGKEVREMIFGEVVTLFDELFDNSTRLTSVLFPYAPTLATYRRNRAQTKLSELFTEIVRSRKCSKRVEEDVLQSLVDSQYNNGCPTTEEVTGMVMSLIFAGKHTSTGASTWTGACLLSHARWYEAAMEEQEQIISKYGDQVDYNALQEMDILHRCVKEALRMHPSALVFLRRVQKNFVVRTKDGIEYEIPRGHTIASPVLYNNYIPYIYKDPDVFDPDRFRPGREEDKVGGKFSYTSFGGGRHACPGEAFAYMQLKAIYSCLIRNFELELVSPFPETSWQKLIPEAKGKVMVSYKRRRMPRT